jgi:hypothetical protein
MLIIMCVFNKPIISYFNSNHNGFNGCLRIVVILPCILVNLKQFILANLLIQVAENFKNNVILVT